MLNEYILGLAWQDGMLILTAVGYMILGFMGLFQEFEIFTTIRRPLHEKRGSLLFLLVLNIITLAVHYPYFNMLYLIPLAFIGALYYAAGRFGQPVEIGGTQPE